MGIFGPAIMLKQQFHFREAANQIVLDVNLLTLDGYYGESEYTIDLKGVYIIHRAYELERRKIQKPPLKTREKPLQKEHAERERNNVHNKLHKIVKALADRMNIFEDKMARIGDRSRNGQNSEHGYITLQRYVEPAWKSYATIYVKSCGTLKARPRCGRHNKEDLRRAIVSPYTRYRLEMDRQKNAANNILIFERGLAQKGAKPYGKPLTGQEEAGDNGAQDFRYTTSLYLTQNPENSHLIPLLEV